MSDEIVGIIVKFLKNWDMESKMVSYKAKLDIDLTTQAPNPSTRFPQ